MQTMQALPPSLLAASLSSCSASELGRIECCALMFRRADSSLDVVAGSIAEFGALLASLSALDSASQVLGLSQGESWKSLWLLVSALLSVGGPLAERESVRQSALEALCNTCAVSYVTGMTLVAFTAVMSEHVQRGCPASFFALRAKQLAQRLCATGRIYEAASFLYNVCSALATGPKRTQTCRSEVQLLTVASEIGLQSLRAGSTLEGEGSLAGVNALRRAAELAKRAVAMARTRLDEEALCGECDSCGREDLRAALSAEAAVCAEAVSRTGMFMEAVEDLALEMRARSVLSEF